MKNIRKQSPPKPLKRERSLSDRIYADLRLRVQRSLGTDERLVDLEVAEEYGTSRMPARDALLRLVNEGYLIGTTRGFVAPTLSAEDVREIFEVRRLLEPEAIASATKNMDDTALAELTAAFERAHDAARNANSDAMMVASIAFRQAWLTRVANKRLIDTISRFVEHAQTVRNNTLNTPQHYQTVMEVMGGVYDALMRRDETAARKQIISFLLAGESAFFAMHSAKGDTVPVGENALVGAK